MARYLATSRNDEGTILVEDLLLVTTHEEIMRVEAHEDITCVYDSKNQTYTHVERVDGSIITTTIKKLKCY